MTVGSTISRDRDGSILDQSSARFRELRRKAQRGIFTETLGVTLAVLLVYAAITYVIDRSLRLEVPFRVVLLGIVAWFIVRIVRDRLVKPMRVHLDDDEMALAVERRSPELQQALISSMQFDRTLTSSDRVTESKELMSAVVADVQGRLAELPFGAALNERRMRRFMGLACISLGLFLSWGILDGQSLKLWALRNLAMSSVEWPRYTKLDFVDAVDGVVRLPQGDAYTVRVGVQGPVPEQVFLTYDFASGESGTESMSRTGDGEYTLTLEALLEDATLRAEGGDGLSDLLRLQIVERPRISDIEVEVVYPPYMEKDAEVIPPTEGEVRLLRGSLLRVAGRSHKTIQRAFVRLGDEEEVPLTVAEDGHAFRGELRPETGGVLALDVLDTDQLGAGTPPRLLLRVVDDKEPRIDLKLRGISSLVTPQARIPGELTIKDDFGLRQVGAGVRALLDTPSSRSNEGDEATGPPPEVPFTDAEVIYLDSLARGAVRYETSASIDLRQFNEVPDADDPANMIRPGMLLSLRYWATDNFGPGEPHEALGEELAFRVVTRDKLIAELRRRQVEQRLELQRIRDAENDALLALAETLNPTADDPRARQARARFKTLARKQQSLGRRCKFVGETYQRILWEYENNRIWEPSKTREIASLTSIPLASLAKGAFPETARQVGEFSDTGDEDLRQYTVDGYKDILARLEAVIKVMEQTETLAALLEQLRGVIKVQDGAIKAVEEQIRKAGANVFGAPKESSSQDKKKDR